MNTGWKKWTALIGVAVLVGVLLVTLVAGTALAQGPQGRYGWNGWMGMGSGVMGGRGYGPGDCPGPGGWGYNVPTDGERLTPDQAAEAVESYLAAYGDSNLTLGEVMEFSNGFYAQVVEKDTGIGAFELLIDPITGLVHPEPGPNMMWNVKYGHMGGWGGRMGYGYRPPTGEMRLSPEEAVQAAQTYLARIGSGLTADDHADPFYGYYTLHTLRDGQVAGMLSVNGYTGQVWYHTWHGDFIGMSEGHE